MKIAPNSATRARRGNIFDFIEFPPTILAGGRATLSREIVHWACGTLGFACAGPRTNQQPAHPKRSRPRSKPKLNTLNKHKLIARQNALDAWVLKLIEVKV